MLVVTSLWPVQGRSQWFSGHWKSLELVDCRHYILDFSPLSLRYLNQALQGPAAAAHTQPPILGFFMVPFNFKFLEGELLSILRLYTLRWDSCKTEQDKLSSLCCQEVPSTENPRTWPPITWFWATHFRLGISNTGELSSHQGPHGYWKCEGGRGLPAVCAHSFLLCVMRTQ